jgi:hypothetical protein
MTRFGATLAGFILVGHADPGVALRSPEVLELDVHRSRRRTPPKVIRGTAWAGSLARG